MYASSGVASMFVADNALLIGNGDSDIGVCNQENTLAGQSAFQSRVDGAINKIFFFIGNFLDEMFPFFHVDMAGGAGAYAATVVIEVDIVFFREFQHRHIQKIARHRFGGDTRIFKLISNCSHKVGLPAKMRAKIEFKADNNQQGA